MGRMTLNMHNALKSTLKKLTSTCKNGLLVYGSNNLTKETFCKKIDIVKNMKRLLSCTRIEIRGLGFYTQVEKHFVAWIKENVRLPTQQIWCNLASAHNWLKYNVSDNLYCMKLSIGKIDYYMILREEWLIEFRNIAFK